MNDTRMVTDYVQDTSAWNLWQHEYRFGALMIVPPEPVLSQVNTLRSGFRWAQSADCDAHISLTVRLPRPLTSSHWTELALIAAKIKSFPIHYGPLKQYLPFPGVCLAITPQVELDKLRAALEGASCFADAQSRPYPFSAHMTIADKLTVPQTEELMISLANVAPTGSFVCSHVSYVVPDANLRFAERAQLELVG